MSGSNNFTPNYQCLLPSSSGSNLYMLQVESSSLHLFLNDTLPTLPLCSPLQLHRNTTQPPVSSQIAKQSGSVSNTVRADDTLKSTQNCNTAKQKPSSSQKESISTNLKQPQKVKTVRNLRQTEKAKKEPNKSTHEKKDNENNKIKNFIHIPDSIIPPRALAVLPSVLVYRKGCFLPKKKLPPRVRFGPVEGATYKIFPGEADELVYEAAVTSKPIFLMNREEESVTYINVSNKEISNWFSLLPLGNSSTANIWLYEEENQLYGITTELISSRTPLALGYSMKYAEDHKLPRGQPVLDIDEALSQHNQEWWCFECRRGMRSSGLLQRHIQVYHNDDRRRKRSYQCKFCLKIYRRLFTYRRHMSMVCRRKRVKSSPDTTIEKEILKKSTPEIHTPPTQEENKIPSDESFQNYTTGLDFSTNLFDTDRISNLDISGSLKSENEFSLGMLKFDNLDNNDDYYNKFSEGLIEPKDIKVETKEDDLTEVTCTQCKQTMTKAKKRRHLRECPARRFECECGRVFRRKQTLAQHIFTEHNEAQISNSDNDSEKNDDAVMKKPKQIEYQCHVCEHRFKRRGMLVNHLWRIHELTDATVPMERRERHYPCALCPKLYRTASKRDRHQQKYHPGARTRAAPIEGERKSYEPAKCTACPRQYVTRAKLLQHMRAAHPELALKLSEKSKQKNENLIKSPSKQQKWTWST